MITFLTLFLGLATGPQPVALAVASPVTRVEIVVDGAVAAELTGPPWTTTVDLGDELRPLHLEAVGYDRDDREVARVRQAVNLHTRRAEAELALERDAAGRPVAARLIWQSVEHPQPHRVDVRLDGEILEVTDPRRFALPAVDPGAVHVLSAELVFPDASTARADLALGGEVTRIVAAHNTALAVTVGRSGTLAGAADAAGLVRAGDNPVPVVAVEAGAADLVVVPDRGAEAELAAMRPEIERLGDRDRGHLAAGLDAGDRLFLVSSQVRVPAAALDDDAMVTYTVNTDLELAPGEHTVAVGLRDTAGGKTSVLVARHAPAEPGGG